MEHNQAQTKQGQYDYQPTPSKSWQQSQQQQGGPPWQHNQQSLQYNKKPWQQNQQPRKQKQHFRQQNQHLWQQNKKSLQHSQQSWNQNQQLQQESKMPQQQDQQTRQQTQHTNQQLPQHVQQQSQSWQQNQQSWQQNQSPQQFNKQQNKNQFQHQKQMTISESSTANQRLAQPTPHPLPNQTPPPQTNQTILPPPIHYPYPPPPQSLHQLHNFQVPPPHHKFSQNFDQHPNANRSNRNQEKVQESPEQSYNQQQTSSYQQRQYAYPPQFQDNNMEFQNSTQNVSKTWHPVFTQPVIGEVPVEVTQKEKDQQWINNFVLGAINVKEPGNEKLKKQQIKIPQAKNMIRNYRRLLDDLKLQRDLLVENVDVDPETWQQALQQISEIKRKLKSVSEEITDPAFISQLSEKLKMRQKKTLNLKRRRQADRDERQEYLDKIEEINKKINANIEKAKKEKLEELKEKQLQKEIDTTLFEVRKKKKEADKTLEILRGLRKLRQVRKISSEQKGVVLPVSSETIFEQRISQMEQFMNRQRAVYTAEEQAMQVMLEEEQEETKEQERQMLQEKLKEKEMKQLQLRRKFLFGNENIDDPNLIPFNEFYKQSEVNMDAFLHIRYTWDQCLVLPNTDDSSSIPVPWVTPDLPSSRIWKTAVADSLD